MSKELRRELSKVAVSPLFDFDVTRSGVAWIDLSGDNPLFASVDLKDGEALERVVREGLARANASVGIGGYNEDRVWYQRSELFSGEEEIRTVHLGVDVWCPAGTRVFAPLDGVVHSFHDNAHFGDYGPTIILQHSLASGTVHTLYGHLSRRSLEPLRAGTSIRSGEPFAEIGERSENGEWPPHLHFQIIISLDGKSGDYPGVCSRRSRERYLENCPDPNLIIRSEVLAARGAA